MGDQSGQVARLANFDPILPVLTHSFGHILGTAGCLVFIRHREKLPPAYGACPCRAC
jgi:hypothetical protein